VTVGKTHWNQIGRNLTKFLKKIYCHDDDQFGPWDYCYLRPEMSVGQNLIWEQFATSKKGMFSDAHFNCDHEREWQRNIGSWSVLHFFYYFPNKCVVYFLLWFYNPLLPLLIRMSFGRQIAGLSTLTDFQIRRVILAMVDLNTIIYHFIRKIFFI
jgi:hypothetical protein